jgi:hypothetical protein
LPIPRNAPEARYCCPACPWSPTPLAALAWEMVGGCDA